MFSKNYGNQYLGSEFCFIGHSLGGALAVLNSLNSLISGYKTFIYSYCQPRIGGDKFNYFLYSQLLRNPESKYFLFFNKDDKVNDLPPRKFGYIHLSEFLQEKKYDLANYQQKDSQDDDIGTINQLLRYPLESKVGFYYSKILHSLFLYKIGDLYYLLHS